MKFTLVAITGIMLVCCHVKNSERTVNNPSKIRLAEIEEFDEQLPNTSKENGRSTTKNDTSKSMEKTIKWRLSKKSQYTTDVRVQGKKKSVESESGNILRLNSELQEYLNTSFEIRVQSAKKTIAEMDKRDKKIGSKQIIRHFPGTRIRRSVGSVVDSINCTSPLLSCKGRCANKRDAGGTQTLRCSCDPYCDHFKDCCADYVQYCLGEPSTNTTRTAAIKVPDEQWTCTRSGIWMIALCPSTWTNQDINQSCISRRSMTADNYEDKIPVITADNKTYANRFCAQCHGYGLQQFKYYKLDFESLVFPPSQATEEEKVRFLFKYAQKISTDPSDKTPRRYCYKIIEKCSEISLPEMQRRCEDSRYGLVYDTTDKKTFKNVYCGHCNGVLDVAGLQCGPGRGPHAFGNSPGQARPFSLIMDIGQMSFESRKTEISCPRGNVYDVYLDTCRKGRQYVPVVSNVEKYRVALWMKLKTNIQPYLRLFNETTFVEYFTQRFMLNSTAVTSVEITCLDCEKYLYLVEFDLDISNYKPNASKGNVYKSRLAYFWPKRIPFVLKIMLYHFDVIKITSKPLTCRQTDVFTPNEYIVLADDSSSSIFVHKTGEMLTAREYFSINSRFVDETLVPVGEIVVCRQMPSGNCSGTYIFLHKHEYVIFPNRSVLYNASGHLYEYGTYMWENGTIMICTNFTEKYAQSHSNTNTNDDKVLTILTYIGFSISVVCLLFVLVTYTLFADLRTIPGVNLMNLCSALLVAQLLWLVGSGLTFTGLGCMVIAIVLHYSFLASFWWMSIIAFNTWRAFSGNGCTRRNRTDKGQRRKDIVRTMAVGWLPLVMYVTICVTLDTSGTVAIGYGGDKGCWINNSRANLYFFAIPVGLSLFWNAVYFVLIIKEIKKAIDQSQMVASQHQARKDSRVYARIAVLMGFMWVFGLVAPFTSYYLMYPFVILNTLQGLYIAVAFAFTRRVRILYKNRGMKTNVRTTTGTQLQTL